MKHTLYRIYLCVMVFACFIITGCKDNFDDWEEQYHAIDAEYRVMPLKLVSTIWAIDGTGGRFHCTINADEHVSWQITGLPSWLTFSQTRGTGSAEITYSVTENPSASTERTAYFALESISKEHSIKIPYYARQYVQQETFAVDLGLSVKWASCNIGATKSEEYGKYYAWGETEEKSDYSWATYKWCDGTKTSLTKYCTDRFYGLIDDKLILEPEDDVARVKWGGNWRIPTTHEISELLDSCTWEWVTNNGVEGQLVTGPNGNSIFLPAAGLRRGTFFVDCGSYGHYYSAENYCSYAMQFFFDYNSVSDWASEERCCGYTIRPVTE